MSTDPNEFLMGGGSASAKFEAVGDTVTGKIAAVDIRQQTDLAGEPLIWDNGDPRMQMIVTIETDAKDNDDDDGKRNVYVKGSKTGGTQSLHDAVRTAVQAAGVKGIEVGGTLTVGFVGTEASKTKGYSDRKLYTAHYVAPDKATESGEYLGTVPPAAAASAPAPVATTATGPSPAAKAKELLNLGVPHDVVASQTGLDLSVVAALAAA